MSSSAPTETKKIFALFLPLYVIYLAPIIYALAMFEPSANDHVLRFQAPSITTTVVWLAMCTLYYFANNWILFISGGTVRIKAAAERKEDLLRMCQLAIPALCFARVHNRLVEAPLQFTLLFAYFGFFYTVLYEAGKKLDIVFVPKSLVGNVYALTIVVLTSIVVIWCLIHHYQTMLRVDGESQVLSYALLVIVAHVLLFFLPPSAFAPLEAYHLQQKATHTFLHLHHWWWSYPCAFYCILSTTPSTVGVAMFITCHLHGLATFGLDPVYNSHSRAIQIGVVETALTSVGTPGTITGVNIARLLPAPAVSCGNDRELQNNNGNTASLRFSNFSFVPGLMAGGTVTAFSFSFVREDRGNGNGRNLYDDVLRVEIPPLGNSSNAVERPPRWESDQTVQTYNRSVAMWFSAAATIPTDALDQVAVYLVVTLDAVGGLSCPQLTVTYTPVSSAVTSPTRMSPTTTTTTTATTITGTQSSRVATATTTIATGATTTTTPPPTPAGRATPPPTSTPSNSDAATSSGSTTSGTGTTDSNANTDSTLSTTISGSVNTPRSSSSPSTPTTNGNSNNETPTTDNGMQQQQSTIMMTTTDDDTWKIIVGVVVGMLVGCAVLVALVVLVRRRRSSDNHDAAAAADDDDKKNSRASIADLASEEYLNMPETMELNTIDNASAPGATMTATKTKNKKKKDADVVTTNADGINYGSLSEVSGVVPQRAVLSIPPRET